MKPQEGLGARTILRLAFGSLSAFKGQFVLTMLGMVVGSASMVLVVSVGLTGKEYVLRSLEQIGTNIIAVDYAYGGPGEPGSDPSRDDYLTHRDELAVVERVRSVTASSPMLTLRGQVSTSRGTVKNVKILGVAPSYRTIRNLLVMQGRFFDLEDDQSRAKAIVMTPQLAREMFGREEEAVGRNLPILGQPFTVIGIFRERVNTFGQSEIDDDTVLIPYSVARLSLPTDGVNQIFFSIEDRVEVNAAALQILEVVKARHRPGSEYRVITLTDLLTTAASIANALTVMLVLISIVTLATGGVGIMNIMLSAVAARVHEIGVRKSLGATRRVILLQFLIEAMTIALAGGSAGTGLAIASAIAVRVFTPYRVPISAWSAAAALCMACVVGLFFGTLPAIRAAQLDPVEALRQE
jgi:putative ABC transport system permease protein